MVDYTVTLTAQEDNILKKVATLIGKTPEEVVESKAKAPLKAQVIQYLEEECVNKVKSMTITQKLTFLQE